MRSGVNGSSRPGLSRTGIFITGAGIHSELTAGALLGSETPSEEVVGKIVDDEVVDAGDALVEDVQRHVAGESGDDRADLRHGGVDFPHVHPDERVGKTGEGGERLDVLLRRLDGIAAWEIGVEEKLGGLLAVGRKSVGGNRVECGLGLGDLEKVAADQSGIRGVGGQRFPVSEVEIDQVMGSVFTAEAEDGDVHEEVPSEKCEVSSGRIVIQ